MSDQRIDDSLIPPVADRRYVPQPPAGDYDDRYRDPSGRRAVWMGLLVGIVIIGGGLFYFGHRSEMPSTRMAPTTTGTAPTSEPRPVPQVPVPPAPPVRAQ